MKLNVYSRLGDLPVGYAPLFAAGHAESFFYTLPWFENLAQYALDSGEELRLYGLEVDEGAEAKPVAALMSRSQGSSNFFRGRRLSSLSNYYTTRFRPLVAPDADSQNVIRELVQAICKDRPLWDAIDLRPLDRESGVYADLVQALRNAGMVVQTYFCSGNWYCPINGRSYLEYLEGLRSSVRNIAKSKNRKIERSGRVQVRIVTNCEGLDEAVRDYEKIYAASWKVPEPYPHFVPGLIRRCAAAGWLRLGLAYVDGEPAAAQLWVVHQKTASIYKIAYDRRFSDLSVGTYLTMRMMERAIDVDKVREVDYLSGDDSYKRDWMSHRRELWGILALNPRTVHGMLGIARHVGGRALKRAGHWSLWGPRLVAEGSRSSWKRLRDTLAKKDPAGSSSEKQPAKIQAATQKKKKVHPQQNVHSVRT